MPKRFAITALGNEIEYVTTNDKGMIVGERKKVTKQVQAALAEWFLATGENNYFLNKSDGKRVSVFCTTDEDQAERIFEILEEAN